MKVFCHEHKRGFFAPRQSPIKCENRGHVLGELDFAGQGTPEGKSSFPFQWQYCCNCEHFSVINFDDGGLQRCPVCTRGSSTLFLCDRCNTITFESNTPLQTKNFTLTSEGAPRPCCPGCLQPASADLREHTCNESHVSFATGLDSCPICGERLDIGPSFPSSVTQYVGRTKSANKLNVTFDYESGLFVAVEDGEFVLITNTDSAGRTIVLPRSPRLSTPKEFYELYQDYYHCALPDTGEIDISEPAVVIPTLEGWKLLGPGTFAVVNDQPKLKTPLAVTPERANPPRPEQSRVANTEPDDSYVVCTQCGTSIETKYAFCWKCGHPREAKNEVSRDDELHVRPRRKTVRPNQRPGSRLLMSDVSADDIDDEEATVQHEMRSVPAPTSPWSSSELLKGETMGRRSVLKLFAVALGSLLVVSVTLLALRHSSAIATSTTASQTSAPIAQVYPTPQANVDHGGDVGAREASLQMSATTDEDTALARLRQIRMAARPSNRSNILKELSETEGKYADDYRFPYEKAKLIVKDHKDSFHEEAFAALARAAQKAISKGKAGEMLNSLIEDSAGDFRKLSHGHREWEQLQQALRRKDASALNVNEGL